MCRVWIMYRSCIGQPSVILIYRLHGLWMGYTLSHGTCMLGHVWVNHVGHMWALWVIYGSNMGHMGHERVYMDHVWLTHGSRMGHTWVIMGQQWDLGKVIPRTSERTPVWVPVKSILSLEFSVFVSVSSRSISMMKTTWYAKPDNHFTCPTSDV